MNDRKLKKLFESARNDSPPSPPADFESNVLRALRHEPQARAASVSLSDALGNLFPRLAAVAVLIIGLSIATDFCLSAFDGPDLSDGIAEISEQWLYAEN